MKRPAFQWYPGDWRRDTALMSCSIEARGLWIEMLNLMHDGEPYGHLTAGGVPIDAAALGNLTGIPSPKLRLILKELEDRRIFSRTEEGVVFSRRMVRDEALRTRRAAGGKLGGNPALLPYKDIHEPPNKPGEDIGKVNHHVNGDPTPATATAVATAKELQQPVVVIAADAGILLSVAANAGLAEHPTRPQPIARVIGTSGRTLEATEAIIAAGVPIPFAEQAIREIARTHTADGAITSLKYFVDGTVRAWQQHQAGATNGANAARRRRPRTSTTPQHFDYPPATVEDVPWKK